MVPYEKLNYLGHGYFVVKTALEGCFGQKLFRIAERPKEKLRPTSLPAETLNATENPNKRI